MTGIKEREKMQQQIYQWVRTLSVFYILFTVMLQLVPDRKYERYIRSFMGLLLIFMLLSPAAALLRKSGEFITGFQSSYEEEMSTLKQIGSEYLQAFYLKQGYEQEAAEEIRKICEENGINLREVTVYIEGEEVKAVIRTAGNGKDGEEGRIQDALWRTLGIRQENCTVLSDADGNETVGGSSACGDTSDGNLAAGVG